MPSWDEIINQVESAPNGVIDITRKEYISKLAEIRGRNVICYYSGWLQDSQGVQETSLLDTDMTGFMTNVHELDRSKGLDLILHTPGGDLAAAEKLVDYLRDCFDGDIEAFVPHMAMSAGTMIACACKKILHGETIVDWSHRPAIQWYTSRRRSGRIRTGGSRDNLQSLVRAHVGADNKQVSSHLSRRLQESSRSLTKDGQNLAGNRHVQRR